MQRPARVGAAPLVLTLRPASAELTDLVAVLTLVMLGAVGFRTSFQGSAFLIVALCGTLLGIAVAYGAVKANLPATATAAGAVVVFAGFGALALPRLAALRILPTPPLLAGLIDGSVRGWVRLLTTLPPAGSSDNLFAIPYLCGFVGGFLGVLAALRLRRWAVCVLPPAAVLLAAILVGTDSPASLLLQGGAFGAVAVAWLSVRYARERTLLARGVHWRRFIQACSLLAVAALLGLAVGPRLPVLSGRPRFVLRDHLLHFDPKQYASPLVGFRSYISQKDNGPVLFTVTGLPAGTPIRVATLDGYDNLVWGATGDGTGSSGTFERIGPSLPGPFVGTTVHTTFTIDAQGGIWVPDVGTAESFQFSGLRARQLDEGFRFNRATQTGAEPMGLVKGDSYSVSAAVPPTSTLLDQAGIDPLVNLPPLPAVPPAIKSLAAQIAAGTGPDQRAKALVTWFQTQGSYSDGGPGVAPGHSLARLEDFLSEQTPVGDAEQYASAMALLARSIGLPARVVLGYRPKGSATTSRPLEVRGNDIDAWVEIAFAGFGWVPFYPTPDHLKTPPTNRPPPKPQEQANAHPVPPQVFQTPPLVPGQGLSAVGPLKDRHPPHRGFAIPHGLIVASKIIGPPLALLVVLCVSIVWSKLQRCKRRRTRGSPASQVAGAWAEILDYARDLGRAVPERATRLEAARFIEGAAVRELASDTDAALFGPDDPNAAASMFIWKQADQVRAALSTSLSHSDRLRAVLSLTSLRAPRIVKRGTRA